MFLPHWPSHSSRPSSWLRVLTDAFVQDPDIMAILQDPVMQSILQQAKGDPAALQDHMKNPGIAGKIQKLIAAGESCPCPPQIPTSEICMC